MPRLLLESNRTKARCPEAWFGTSLFNGRLRREMGIRAALGARILTMGDGNAPPYLQLANIWMILNVGGGPTPDKPTVTLSTPDPNHINSFMNFRVADIQACYELWKSRGAEFLTPPIPKYGEIRCYIRDPDGYIIEVGQSTGLKYG